MRILAIRGENLASLARPFELDLTAEPLAGAGLFAITGETGSGKSTILDALCLALYGQYPRIAVGKQENVPDPSGKALSISDGRAILRRGAAAGFAEVDFLGHDGIGYRVRWAVARARGKANGKLQDVQRSLRRLADDSAVAQQITSVLKEVEARTNLTFEQFRRTVLLAQGDFDAFLLADERDRAELLEKVTGTEVYGSISIRVRQGTDQLRREVDVLEQRRLDIGLLDADVRLAVEEAQTALAETIGKQEYERERLASELEKRRNIAAAQENLRVVKEQLIIAQQQRDGAQDEFTALAELDEVEPHRLAHILAKDAAEALPGAAQKVTATTTALARTANASQAADDHLAKAQGASREAESVFKGFGPAWTKAEGLDTLIHSAREEVQNAQQEAGNAEQVSKAQKDRLDSLQGSLVTANREYEQATHQLELQSKNAALAERLDEVLALLQKHKEKVLSGHAAMRNSESEKTTSDDLQKDVAEAESRTQAADQLRKALKQQGDTLRDQLGDLNESRLQSLEAGIAQLVLDLREADRAADRAISAAVSVAEAGHKEKQALAEGVLAGHNLNLAQAEIDSDTTSLAKLVPLDDLAQQSVSHRAALVRSFLLRGEACPVCGSAVHPYSDATDVERRADTLATLAESLRKQRQELNAAIAAAANTVNAESAKQAAAAARISEAVRRADVARLEGASAVEEFARLRPAMVKAVSAFALTKRLPTSLSVEVKVVLVTLAREASAAHQAAKKELESAKQLRVKLDSVRIQQATAQTRFDAEQRSKQDPITKLHAAELRLQRSKSTADNSVRDLKSIEDDLSPFLAGASLQPEALHQDAAGTRTLLYRVAKSYQGLKEQISALGGTVLELEPKCTGADVEMKSACRKLAECNRALEQRLEILKKKMIERAALLGGEATDMHRTRFNEVRTSAIAAQNSASDEQCEAASANRGAVVASEQAVTAHAEARSRADETRNAFREASVAAGRTCDWIIERLTIPSINREKTRVRLMGIDKALNVVRGNLTTRSKDLETASANTDETVTAPELLASLNSLSEEIRSNQQLFGENASEIKRDRQAQDAARALGVDTDASREQLTAWQAVDDAVGSPDGSRFRKFVQSITLGHLIRLANDHLRGLGPRYQLAQGSTSDLTVHVVDRDMADEVRAARSLSGGERFLVSLSLALALSGLEGRSSFVDTLFIDEGFGSLDQETLDTALNALESLQSGGRKVAVVTHVAAMIDRIPVQVRVEKLGGGNSVVRLANGLIA